MNAKWIVAWLLILWIALGVVAGCGAPAVTPTPLPTWTPLPTLTPAPTRTPPPVPTPTKGAQVPIGSTRLIEEQADLDGDGTEEIIVAYRSGELDGLAIDGWRVELPQGRRIHRLELRPIVYNTPPQALLFVEDEDGVSKYLYVYDWDGEEGKVLPPQDGPLAGDDAFRSAHYWPTVEDGDMSGTEEIVVLREAENPDFLEVFYYAWDGEAFYLSTLFMSLPRAAPKVNP